jgi:hypothetical protein
MENKQSFTPLTKEQYHAIKKDDVIERMLAFSIPMYLVVQSVTDTIIDCGWTFDRNTGIEVDDDIPTKVSYIRRVLTEEQKQIPDSGEKVVPYP